MSCFLLSCLLSFLLGCLLPEVVRRLMRRPEVRDPVPEVRVPVPGVREVREPEPELVRRREVRGRGMPYEVHLAATGQVFHIDPDCFGLRIAIRRNIRVRTACQVCCRDRA